jgi:hypothetical protein
MISMERVTWKGCTSMKNTINFKELMKHEVKTKIIVEELNEPDLDRMGKAIWNLLLKK